MSKNQEFDLEYQYQQYLKRVALNEAIMPENQKTQLRQAFMGACGQMLMLLRDDVGALSEKDAIDTMQDMINQVLNYFTKAANKNN